MHITERYRTYYGRIGLPADLQRSYIEYVRILSNARVPVIFDFNHLAELLGRTPYYLASSINASHAHYRTFKIPKRLGGFREIAAPYPSLLGCQNWIHRNILKRAELHKCCHGFASKRSIATNARVHLGQPEMLKVDLKEFFPSIPIDRVIAVFRGFGYMPNVAFYLASLCCLRGRLPQGAATSPMLSNIIAKRLDARLFGLARKFGLRYSRYADDLTFSGEAIRRDLLASIRRIIENEGFMVCEPKIRLYGAKDRKIVTGLNVTGEKLTIPREFKRTVRRDVYYVCTRGYLDHLNNRKIKDPFYIDSLYGKLLFWGFIEPKNPFLQKYLPAVEKLARRVQDDRVVS